MGIRGTAVKAVGTFTSGSPLTFRPIGATGVVHVGVVPPVPTPGGMILGERMAPTEPAKAPEAAEKGLAGMPVS